VSVILLLLLTLTMNRPVMIESTGDEPTENPSKLSIYKDLNVSNI